MGCVCPGSAVWHIWASLSRKSRTWCFCSHLSIHCHSKDDSCFHLNPSSKQVISNKHWKNNPLVASHPTAHQARMLPRPPVPQASEVGCSWSCVSWLEHLKSLPRSPQLTLSVTPVLFRDIRFLDFLPAHSPT